MSISPTSVEVERAKSQLKAGLLLTLDGTTAVAEDIGRQLVTSGRRFTPQQIESAVDAVTIDEIKRVAQKYLWDKDVGIFRIFFPDHVIDSSSPLSSPSLRLEVSMAFLTTTVSVQTCRP